MKISTLGLLAAVGLALTACATPKQYDYAAFLAAKPSTLLVMPPLNESPDIKATPGVWANATRPLSEAGYYVLPITLVDETFKQNGVTSAYDAQSLPIAKLREVFQADAAVYIKVKQYGASYKVLSSETVVEAEAKIIDLRSGSLLWEGRARASSAEQQQQQQQGVIGMLVTAVVNQIVASASDAAYGYAVIADQRLLGAPRFNGVLPGPRSTQAWQVPSAQR